MLHEAAGRGQHFQARCDSFSLHGPALSRQIICLFFSCGGLACKTISVSRCELLEIRPFYRKLSSRKRGNSLSVFHRNSLKYSNDQRGKLEIDSLFT